MRSPQSAVALGTGRPSPCRGRAAEGLLECARERRFGVVAHKLGNLRQRGVGAPELLRRHLHAPVGEIVHGRHSDQAAEAVSQR